MTETGYILWASVKQDFLNINYILVTLMAHTFFIIFTFNKHVHIFEVTNCLIV